MSTKTVLFAAAALAGAAYVSAQAAPAWQYVSIRARRSTGYNLLWTS
jgi:hypothetical protein